MKPTTAALPGLRVDLADELPALGLVVLDERDRARERALVAREQALGEARVVRGGRHGRAMMPATLVAAPAYHSPAMDSALLAARRSTPSPPPCAASRRRATAGRSRCCASCAAHADAQRSSTRGCSLRLGWLKLRWRGRLQTDGMRFVGPGVHARDRPRRARRARPLVVDRPRHARSARTRARSRSGPRRCSGQECTISAFQHVRDRARVHRRRPRDADRLRPRRRRGRAPDPRAGDLQARRARRPQRAGSATACASCAASRSATTRSSARRAVVTHDVPANAVMGGVPARVIRMRETPRTLRWE